jgi:glycosyltransferase involved in cell wall biosynthesis
MNQIESLGKEKPKEYILGDLIENKNINILYVGEISSETGILMLLDIVRRYMDCYGNTIKLRIITKQINDNDPYFIQVRERINSYGLSDSVDIIDKYDNSSLLSFYLGSDVYISCSEKEEDYSAVLTAQYLGLPVIALSESNIIEALGENQIILGYNITEYVAAIKVITENEKYLDYIEKQGRQNFINRFSSESTKKELTKVTGEMI